MVMGAEIQVVAEEEAEVQMQVDNMGVADNMAVDKIVVEVGKIVVEVDSMVVEEAEVQMEVHEV